MLMKFLVTLFLLYSFTLQAATNTSNNTSFLKKINLNTANVLSLQTLKGVGPKKANAIVEYRTLKGNFKSLDDLLKVKGFTHKSVDKLKKNNPDRISLENEDITSHTN